MIDLIEVENREIKKKWSRRRQILTGVFTWYIAGCGSYIGRGYLDIN